MSPFGRRLEVSSASCIYNQRRLHSRLRPEGSGHIVSRPKPVDKMPRPNAWRS